MSERQVHLQLDVIIHGSVISGHVSSAARPDRRFTGRLGMIAAIEDALETVAKPDRSPGATDSGVDQLAP